MPSQIKIQLLAELEKTVQDITESYRGFSNYTFQIDSERTAKDILEHIVFWHESFARNTYDVSHGIKPKPLRGSYAKLSEQCTMELKDVHAKKLIERLVKAQETIRENIVHPAITTIPYRVGSRDYTPEEHLDVVNQHFLGHLKEVNEAYC